MGEGDSAMGTLQHFRLLIKHAVQIKGAFQSAEEEIRAPAYRYNPN